jgi:tetratricopeptide (TPR) repeat protein
MRKNNLLLMLGLMIITSIACKPAKEKNAEKIAAMEKELMSVSAKIDTAKAQLLIDAYISYVDTYKSDTVSPFYLFKAADISMNMLKHQQALQLLDRVLKDYNNFPKLADCLFLKAFIYENQLRDFEKEKSTYHEFLQKYPEHELAASAKAAIDNMGIPIDILIKSFEEKNKKAKDSVKV